MRSTALTLELGMMKSPINIVRALIGQAEGWQMTSLGADYTGAVLKHLVRAKLDCVFGHRNVQHNKAGDLFLGDVTIHVAASPEEALIQQCQQNAEDGLRPVLVTLQQGLSVAEGLSNNIGLGDRIDIFEIGQFVALNVYKMGRFTADGRQSAMTEIVDRYNKIVEEVETDPSLKIQLRQ